MHIFGTSPKSPSTLAAPSHGQLSSSPEPSTIAAWIAKGRLDPDGVRSSTLGCSGEAMPSESYVDEADEVYQQGPVGYEFVHVVAEQVTSSSGKLLGWNIMLPESPSLGNTLAPPAAVDPRKVCFVVNADYCANNIKAIRTVLDLDGDERRAWKLYCRKSWTGREGGFILEARPVTE